MAGGSIMLSRMAMEDRRRRMSREAILGVLREQAQVSRADLVRRTGLSRPTVSSIVAELQRAGIAEEDPQPAGSGGAGRPVAHVRLNRNAGVALGMDFGKRHLRVALADLGHR